MQKFLPATASPSRCSHSLLLLLSSLNNIHRVAFFYQRTPKVQIQCCFWERSLIFYLQLPSRHPISPALLGWRFLVDLQQHACENNITVGRWITKLRAKGGKKITHLCQQFQLLLAYKARKGLVYLHPLLLEATTWPSQKILWTPPAMHRIICQCKWIEPVPPWKQEAFTPGLRWSTGLEGLITCIFVDKAT